MQSTLREMLKRKNIPSAITFIADQTPSAEGCHWMNFLNQDTPVFLGVEKMAKKFNYPVVYGDMYRKTRGNYVVNFKMLTENPQDMLDFEITEMHMNWLEESIKKNPQDWLWSHRRWKHKKPAQK
jgi:KDO2-lipid IV(A) lauroyltransferase